MNPNSWERRFGGKTVEEMRESLQRRIDSLIAHRKKYGQPLPQVAEESEEDADGDGESSA